jgi:glutathione peroxidase
MSIYEYSIKNIKNEDVPLDQYKGKVLLIVNTASKCGYTPQYEGLEALYEAYHEQGFEIIDLPCNQFLSQAPGTNQELAEFCQFNYGTQFETFAKVRVNGKDAIDLYKYLKDVKPYDETPGDEGLKPSLKNKLTGSKIKWNFTKFLIDRDGQVFGRYSSRIKPEKLGPVIEKLL